MFSSPHATSPSPFIHHSLHLWLSRILAFSHPRLKHRHSSICKSVLYQPRLFSFSSLRSSVDLFLRFSLDLPSLISFSTLEPNSSSAIVPSIRALSIRGRDTD
ncbi:hypothetical protein HGRIS_009230 [Hohenbuehelia grisea]|uniref:Uncharacterized protein n=1 Tax=Hohenbuehelia grisea TaxID=104357 RepID=A0ABR3J0N5_9AGAR